MGYSQGGLTSNQNFRGPWQSPVIVLRPRDWASISAVPTASSVTLRSYGASESSAMDQRVHQEVYCCRHSEVWLGHRWQQQPCFLSLQVPVMC